MSDILKTAFKLAYEDSPIILQDGLAQFMPGGVLPVIFLTEMFDLPGVLAGELFAHFKPLPGGTLQEWAVAEYPFANLQMAANAVVKQPLKISMLMACPAQNNGGYVLKQAMLTALKIGIEAHVLAGGSFTVITPAFTYTNCLLTGIHDVSSPSDKQVQYMFQWDFVQPLITQSGAEQVLGSLMSKFSNGLPVNATNLSWAEIPPTSVSNPLDPNGYNMPNGESVGS